MKSAFRFRRPRPVVGFLLGCLLVVAVGTALFDWNWLRGPFERYLSEKSGRSVTFEDMHVAPGFEPTLRLRGVYVENAPWADKRPMAVAAEASLTFKLASLWTDQPIVVRLVLVDADVDLERQADGLRNWRLTNPEYRGPLGIKVLLLEAHRSRLRFVNRELGLDLVGTSEPLPHEEPGPLGETLNSTITLKGEYQGVKFSGEALAHAFITFRESGRSFPLRGYLSSGRTRLEFDGVFSDLIQLGPMDADLQLKGPTLANLHPFLHLKPAPSRPYRLAGHVKQAGDVYEVTHLAGTIGDTDIAGEARYDRSRERPFVSATLRSERAAYSDLAALAGVSSSSGAPRAPWVARPLPVDSLTGFDAEVSLNARELSVEGQKLLNNVHVTAGLAAGAFATRALEFELAGGRVSGSLTLDAGNLPPAGRVRFGLEAVRLEQLLAAFSLPARASGAIDGRVELEGSGASVAAMLASSNGALRLQVSGGRIPNLLDAKLALNPLTVLGAWLSGKPDVPVRCAAAAFDVRGGVGKFRTIALDTDRTRVAGRGSFDLGDERLDVLLTPAPRRPGLLDRHKAIRVRGPLRDLKVTLEEPAESGEANAANARSRCG